jgi:hypothetical protein
MSVLTIIKKIGDKIISVVEWPFVHATMVEKLLSNGCADAPATKAAIVGLVEQFEVIGPDTVADIAAKGFDLAADVKTVNDVKALFAYFSNNFLPVVRKDFADFEQDTTQVTIEAAVDPVPHLGAVSVLSAAVTVLSVAADVPQSGPGLHTVAAA